MLREHSVDSGGMGQYLHVSVQLFSARLVKMSVLFPRVLQKEESVEQPEFRYDEFGFRVDKEGKASLIPPLPLCPASSPSRAAEYGRVILQPFCARSHLSTCHHLSVYYRCNQVCRRAGLMAVWSTDTAESFQSP